MLHGKVLLFFELNVELFELVECEADALVHVVYGEVEMCSGQLLIRAEAQLLLLEVVAAVPEAEIDDDLLKALSWRLSAGKLSAAR